MKTKKPAALSPSQRAFRLVACLRYYWGDRVGQTFLSVLTAKIIERQECLSYLFLEARPRSPLRLRAPNRQPQGPPILSVRKAKSYRTSLPALISSRRSFNLRSFTLRILELVILKLNISSRSGHTLAMTMPTPTRVTHATLIFDYWEL